MLQRTGEAETITTHYLFALGLYRALYIPNWIWRWFTETTWFDPIAVVAGLVQTVLYSDFFWIYYTKYADSRSGIIHLTCTDMHEQNSSGQEIQPAGLGPESGYECKVRSHEAVS